MPTFSQGLFDSYKFYFDFHYLQQSLCKSTDQKECDKKKKSNLKCLIYSKAHFTLAHTPHSAPHFSSNLAGAGL